MLIYECLRTKQSMVSEYLESALSYISHIHILLQLVAAIFVLPTRRDCGIVIK